MMKPSLDVSVYMAGIDNDLIKHIIEILIHNFFNICRINPERFEGELELELRIDYQTDIRYIFRRRTTPPFTWW